MKWFASFTYGLLGKKPARLPLPTVRVLLSGFSTRMGPLFALLFSTSTSTGGSGVKLSFKIDGDTDVAALS
jgi:hypothetical protein